MTANDANQQDRRGFLQVAGAAATAFTLAARPPAARRPPSPPRRTPSPVGYAIGDIALNM